MLWPKPRTKLGIISLNTSIFNKKMTQIHKKHKTANSSELERVSVKIVQETDM